MQSLARLLSKTAEEFSYLDPHKIEEILGMPIPFTTNAAIQGTESKRVSIFPFLHCGNFFQSIVFSEMDDGQRVVG